MIKKTIIFLLIIAITSSCSFFEMKSTTPNRRQLPPQKRLTPTTSVQLEQATEPTTDLDILWTPPTEIADKFIIRYGFSDTELTEKIEVPAKDISMVMDNEHGNVMHYVVKDVPDKKTLYITISAITNGEVTSVSEMFISNPE